MVINAILVHMDQMYRILVAQGDEVTFGKHKKDDVEVSTFDPQQIRVAYKKGKVRLDAKEKYGVAIKDVPLESIILLDKANTWMFFTKDIAESLITLPLPYKGVYKLGRSFEDNDIVIKIPYISSHHCKFTVENGNVRVEDVSNHNGIFLNNKKITIGRMTSGDVLSILGVNIALINGELRFSGVGDRLSIPDAFDVVNRNGMDHPKVITYQKSPRIQESFPKEEIVLATPPSKGQKYERGRGTGLAMLASTGAMTGVSLFSGAVSPALLAARGASMISPITNIASNSKINKSRKKSLEEYAKKREEKFSAYIEDQLATIYAVHDVQRRIVVSENPKPRDWINTVFQLRNNLWERTIGDRDYLDVRVGMSEELLCVPVKSKLPNAVNMEDDELEEMLEQIVEITKMVQDVPMRVSLLRHKSIGVIGDRPSVLSLVRNMIVSLTASHSFNDVKLVCIFDEEEKDYWEAVRWLPHVWDEQIEQRLVACDSKSAERICEYLSAIVTDRSADKRDEGKIHSPHYVVIFANKDLVDKTPLMNALFNSRIGNGVTSLFLYNDLPSLPADCDYIIDTCGDPCAYNVTRSNEKKSFVFDSGISDAEFNGFARRMSAINLIGFSKEAGIPKSISFVEGYGIERFEEIDLNSNWNRPKTRRTLAAPIGRSAGNKDFYFDIHEKCDGPHGLVAGTTGFGKSELLKTWILSMCVNYHPHDVSFVIIDYKGDSLVKPLSPLPHVIGTLTNIEGDITRQLISLQSEIKRRQEAFSKLGSKLGCNIDHLDEYQEYYKKGMVDDPIPYLIIVVDEFVELKMERPDFISGLIRVSRVGRSLGILLVLATQKPGGQVDDQMLSNSRFRMCLKVQSTGDSREMLGRPDAARIREVGRAYLLVGTEEKFELFQSYWSGAPYVLDAKKLEEDKSQLSEVDFFGNKQLCVAERKKKNSGVNKTQIAALVEYITGFADKAHIEKLKGPWNPELSRMIPLPEVSYEYNKGNKLIFPVGMNDIPSLQLQETQYIDMSADGHLAVYGLPGSGKTTFLLTLITSICMNYSPKETLIYAIDCGGFTLKRTKDFPSVGDVLLGEEIDRIINLLKTIINQIESRKKELFDYGVSSHAEYNLVAEEKMPFIVLVIDRISVIYKDNQDIEALINRIVNDGANYGVYLVYTANKVTDAYKLSQSVKNAVAFEMADKSDYSLIVGRTTDKLPSIPGRGFVRGVTPIVFQAAVAATGDNEKERNQSLSLLANDLCEKYRDCLVEAVPTMPDKVTVNLMIDNYANPFVIPFGIDNALLNVATVDMHENYCMLVSGHSGTGKSQMLVNIATMIHSKYSDSLIYVIDSTRESLTALKNYASDYCLVNDEEGIARLIESVYSQLENREKDKQLSTTPLVLLIDDRKELTDNINDQIDRMIVRLCNGLKDLGLLVFIAERTNNIVNTDTIDLAVQKHQNCIALDGELYEYLYFTITSKQKDRHVKPEEGYAHLLTKDECRMINYMKEGE